MLSKNVNNKKCAPIIFNEKKIRNIRMIFDVEKLTLKVKFWHFLTPPHYTDLQNSMISFDCSWFFPRTFLILYPSLENSTTGIAITYLLTYPRVTLISNFLEFPKSLGFLLEFWKIIFGKLVSDSNRQTAGRFKIYWINPFWVCSNFWN